MKALGTSLMLLSLVGCADKGTAPTIESLTCTPSSLVVGQVSMLSCAFNFQDPDGDIDHVHLRYADPTHATSEVDTPVVGGATVTGGPLQVSVTLQALGAGTGELSATLVDVQGNDSNVLVQTLIAAGP